MSQFYSLKEICSTPESFKVWVETIKTRFKDREHIDKQLNTALIKVPGSISLCKTFDSVCSWIYRAQQIKHSVIKTLAHPSP